VTDLSERISMDAFNRAMWPDPHRRPTALSDFGRYHYRSFKRLPVSFVELRATKR